MSGRHALIYSRLREETTDHFHIPRHLGLSEPTGLGAVVEDTAGQLWCRSASAWDSNDSMPWVNAGSEGWCGWADLDVARILTEGVTP